MKLSPVRLSFFCILLFISFPRLYPQTIHDTSGNIPADAVKGDFNGDGKIEFMWLIPPTIDSTGMACIGNCSSTIHFSDTSIPSIFIDQCIGGDPVNLGDLNRNGSHEVGLLQDWFTSCWMNYHVWTLKNGKWVDAVKPFPTHCVQWEQRGIPIEMDSTRKGFVKIYISENSGDGIVTRMRSVAIVK
ncbi:MAG: hypothetical protein ACOYNS_08280 [Bacteroidota bacterium]